MTRPLRQPCCAPTPFATVPLCRWPVRVLKRLADLILTALLLIGLAPLFLLIVWRIRAEDGGQALYVQTRVGRGGRHFPCLKFRSMAVDAESILERWRQDQPHLFRQYQDGNFKLRDDPRVTRIGRLLRTYSMDELPQLINVLRGDMTLIGPRPILPREAEEYGPGLDLYCQVRPGLTGLWQVSGRSETTFRQRADLDGWYIRHWSLLLDLRILVKTVAVVCGGRGAY